MISEDSGALLIIGSFTKQVSDPDFKVSHRLLLLGSHICQTLFVQLSVLMVFFYVPFGWRMKVYQIRKERTAIHVKDGMAEKKKMN